MEVVPGITAALGAAAELQIPLTDRRHTRRVQFVTGHAQVRRAPAHDWPSLADPRTITVFYMGARTFAEMLPKLIAAGLDPATPALAVSAATTPRSAHAYCAVRDLPAVLANTALPQPCLILMGNGLSEARAALSPPPVPKAGLRHVRGGGRRATSLRRRLAPSEQMERELRC